MSALRAHSCERTEGIGTADVLANELEGSVVDRTANIGRSTDSGRSAERAGVEEARASAEHQHSEDGGYADGGGADGRDAEGGDAVSGVDVSEMQASNPDMSGYSASGVAARGEIAASRAVPRRARARAQSGEQSRPSESRAQSFNRYLSAQNDIDEEVLRLYKLVCRV